MPEKIDTLLVVIEKADVPNDYGGYFHVAITNGPLHSWGQGLTRYGALSEAFATMLAEHPHQHGYWFGESQDEPA